MSNYAVEMEKVRKSFGGVQALKNVTLRVKPGQIHALIGENGAGKSTLMKILSGIYLKDAGQIRINGKEVNFTSPKQSQQHRIGIIHQELALSPDLTVAENIFLGDMGFGKPFISWKKMNESAQKALDQLGFPIRPQARLGSLSVAYQQMVEIAKALARDVQVLILDEPTAVLSDKEIDILFTQLRRLKEQGVTIIYISHRLEELFRISDAITVIKDGETITDLDPACSSEDDIIRFMVGREMKDLYPPRNPVIGDVILKVDDLSTRELLNQVSFHVCKGEVVGLAGLVGSGRSEIARCLFGIDRMQSGEIHKAGKRLNIRHPAHAMAEGIGLVPENRKEQGAILSRPIRENMTLSSLSAVCRTAGIFNAPVESSVSESLRRKLSIKMGSVEDPISSLSGGNQQKVVIAKWLATQCDVLILDEPTRGVDVGAKAEIYGIIQSLSEKGYGVIVISSEMVELIGLSHRIYVMSEGSVAGEVKGNDMTEQNIMRLALPKRSVA